MSVDSSSAESWVAMMWGHDTWFFKEEMRYLKVLMKTEGCVMQQLVATPAKRAAGTVAQRCQCSGLSTISAIIYLTFSYFFRMGGST